MSVLTSLLGGGRDGVGNTGEGRVQRAADIVDDAENGNADAGGYQTVFDCGNTGLILRKTPHKADHEWLLSSCAWLTPSRHRLFFEPTRPDANLTILDFAKVKSIRQ